MTIILKPEEIDFEKLSLSKLKHSSKGGSFVYLNYDSQRLYIQTPKMNTPFGLLKEDDKLKYNFHISFKNYENAKGR